MHGSYGLLETCINTGTLQYGMHICKSEHYTDSYSLMNQITFIGMALIDWRLWHPNENGLVHKANWYPGRDTAIPFIDDAVCQSSFLLWTSDSSSSIFADNLNALVALGPWKHYNFFNGFLLSFDVVPETSNDVI